MSLRRIFKFAKPKTPGYGISKHFYYSVLSSHAQLPTPAQVANPAGENGAVEGFIAPLGQGASKEDLQRPLARGVYAVATKDRKTVIRLSVVSKEEAGYDPEPITRSTLALTFSPEVLARIRATWTLLQLNFESHDADVAPSMNFLHAIARRLGELSEGVIADPLSQRYMLPEEFSLHALDAPLEAPDHIVVRFLERQGTRKAFTQGMQKFGLPEFELPDLTPSDDLTAQAFLLSLAQTRFDRVSIVLGDRVGAKSAPFDVAEGGLDKGQWEGIAVWELLPARGKTVSEGLSAWTAETR